MNNIPLSVETKFYQLLNQKISIDDFEKWLYKNKSLEGDLPNSLYYELISLNYADKDVKEKLQHLLTAYVQSYKFEKERIIDYLQSIINRDENCANSILMTYELYCDGYNFLRRLGLEYGLCLVPTDNIPFSEKHINDLLDKFYPKIINDAENALSWFYNDKIIFKSEKQELCKTYDYDDLRNETEILQGELSTIINPIEYKLPFLSKLQKLLAILKLKL